MKLGEPGKYGVAMVFLPVDKHSPPAVRRRVRADCQGRRPDRARLARYSGEWRLDRPRSARLAALHRAVVCGAPERDGRGCIRAHAVHRPPADENEIAASDIEDKGDFYIPSFSCRTIIYKGLMLAPQIEKFYVELANPLVKSALCLVHQRFSTNTFPSWKLAHPYRYICHNGEINTIRGNVSWMNARQSVLESPLFGDQIEKVYPVITPGGSDSASLDNAVEFLFQSGRSLPHVMAMLIPEAWSGNPDMDEDKRAFYEYHASLMEPWDGPAAVAFTDGRVVGATLDRNGLRPGRYIVTKDDLVVLASEAGVIEVPAEDVRKKGRLQPGRMFLVDTVEHRIISDAEIKKTLAGRQPYAEWLKEQQVTLEPVAGAVARDLVGPGDAAAPPARVRLQRRGSARAAWARWAPRARSRSARWARMCRWLASPTGRKQLFSYFKQLFAQVTNPPIDPIREEMVMSLISYIGTERNILDETPENCHTLKLPHPILTNRDLEKLRRVSSGDLLATTLSTLFRAEDGEAGLKHALDDLSQRAA